MTETRTQETNRTVQTQPIAIKMHYICDSDYVSKINKYAVILIAVMTAAFVLTGTHSCQSISDLAIYLSLVSIFCSAFIRMDRHCDFYKDHGRNDSKTA